MFSKCSDELVEEPKVEKGDGIFRFFFVQKKFQFALENAKLV